MGKLCIAIDYAESCGPGRHGEKSPTTTNGDTTHSNSTWGRAARSCVDMARASSGETLRTRVRARRREGGERDLPLSASRAKSRPRPHPHPHQQHPGSATRAVLWTTKLGQSTDPARYRPPRSARLARVAPRREFSERAFLPVGPWPIFTLAQGGRVRRLDCSGSVLPHGSHARQAGGHEKDARLRSEWVTEVGAFSRSRHS